MDRRQLVGLVSAALLSGVPAVAQAGVTRWQPGKQTRHPAPRQGIDASRVLARGDLGHGDAGDVFDLVRQIPQVVDGIRCHCGCADLEGYYSLLSCYESPGMAQHCLICQGEARLVFRLHSEGWSLNGIRRSIDAAFGGG